MKVRVMDNLIHFVMRICYNIAKKPIGSVSHGAVKNPCEIHLRRFRAAVRCKKGNEKMIGNRWKRWGLLALWIFLLPVMLLLLLAMRLSPRLRFKVETAMAG